MAQRRNRKPPSDGVSEDPVLANCPFCGIKRTRFQFAESHFFVALYNIAPILPGHSLVVPKRHVESLFDLTVEELAELPVFGRGVTKTLLEAFNAAGFNWSIQERAEAGQTVSHLHLHVIPRRPYDLPHPGDWYPRLREADEEVVDSEDRRRLRPNDLDRVLHHVRAVAQRVLVTANPTDRADG